MSVHKPRPQGPIVADTWRTLASVYSGSDKHLLPAPSTSPAAYAFDEGFGDLVLNGTIYKVTYCRINPETQEVLAESFPSPGSNSVNVTNGRVAITLPRRISNLMNAFRLYRLTSFRSAVTKTLTQTVQSSSDDASNSTYSVPNTTVVIPAFKGYVATAAGTTRSKQEVAYSTVRIVGLISVAGSASTGRAVFNFKLDNLLASAAITNVTLQVTVNSTFLSTSNLVDINAFANNPFTDPAEITNTGTFWTNCNDATGARRYVEDSTNLRTIGIKEIALGSSSAAQACLDVVSAKTQGKSYNIALKENSEATNICTSIHSPNLKVSYASPATGFATNNQKLYFGNLSDCGIRFTGITIPNGARIKTAKLTLVAFPDGLNDFSGVKLKIRAQTPGASDSATFSTSGDYSGRTKTTAQVNWDIDTSWKSNTAYSTPDLSSVLQEVVSDSDWATGESVVLFVEDNSSNTAAIKVAYSKDGADLINSTYVPRLDITYTDSTSIGTQYRLVDTISCDHTKIYIDETKEDVLNANPELPTAASTDVFTSALQNVFSPVNPVKSNKFRVYLNEKSTFKVPSDKIYFVTHLASGANFPFVLGSTTPISFRFWKSNAAYGYMLCSLPIPLLPGSTISIVEGRGDVYMTGYIVDSSSDAPVSVMWKEVVTGTTNYFTSPTYVMGIYSEVNSTTAGSMKINSNSVVELNNFTNKFASADTYYPDGYNATSSLGLPLFARQGDTYNHSQVSAVYMYGLEVKNL